VDLLNKYLSFVSSLPKLFVSSISYRQKPCWVVPAGEPAFKMSDSLDSPYKNNGVVSSDSSDEKHPELQVQDGISDASEAPATYSKLSTTLMVIFSGLAIGSDGFNASIIGNLSLIFAVIYPDLSTAMYSHLTNAFIIGMIVGMLGFGYISDRMGRKSGAVLTTLILVVGIAMSAAAHGKDEEGMFWMLVISRGIAGVGAGGEYPVSGAGATEATDENSTTRKNRGFIFALIGDLSATFGFVFGGLVPLLLLLCYHQQVKHYEAVWRVSLAMGLIPPLTIFWFRYKMATSTAYRKSAARKQHIPYRLIIKRYWRPLLGCSLGWFL
jgi:MFS family permease